ncbi:MAG: hypothetical protein ACI86M_004043, partial [Saprospiraceae bacterium]
LIIAFSSSDLRRFVYLFSGPGWQYGICLIWRLGCKIRDTKNKYKGIFTDSRKENL